MDASGAPGQDDPFVLPDQDIPLLWRNRLVRATIHILTGDEELALIHRRNQEPDLDARLPLEGFLRLTHALMVFDGHDFAHLDFEAKLAYVSSWPANLIDVLLAQYTTAQILPLLADDETVDSFLAKTTLRT